MVQDTKHELSLGASNKTKNITPIFPCLATQRLLMKTLASMACVWSPEALRSSFKKKDCHTDWWPFPHRSLSTHSDIPICFSLPHWCWANLGFYFSLWVFILKVLDNKYFEQHLKIIVYVHAYILQGTKVDIRRQLVRIRSLLCQVHPGHQTQVFRLDKRCLYTLSHPISPHMK